MASLSHSLVSVWILLIWTFLPTALAQDSPQSTGLVNSPLPSITSAVSTTFATSISSTDSPLQTTTQVDNAPKTTANSSPDSMGNDDDSRDQRSGLLNYYFVFLALFILLLFVGIYFIHKKKRARKARYRNSGQNALARDLDGWTNTRRWMHGNWRTNRSTTTVNRHEGLNELGEAPPPYKAAAAAEDAEVPQIPLGTLSRNGASLPTKPPDYGDALRASRIIPEQDRPPIDSISTLGPAEPTRRP